MYIRLDLFADMLNIPPRDLLQAMRSDGQLGGLSLPHGSQLRGAAVMFLKDEALFFLEKWQARSSVPASPDPDAPLISLDAFASQAGIAPLALWQAASTGKSLRGILLPTAVKSGGGKLMFSATAVGQFIAEFKGDLAKK